MKVLVIGCSHSAGAWKKNLLNQRIWYDSGYGWVSHLARNYNKINFDCYAHPGGGVFNYISTIGHLIKADRLKEYDKIIIQYTDELRVTVYVLPNCEPELYKHPNKFKNLNMYDYANNTYLKKMFQFHDVNHLLKDIELTKIQKDNVNNYMSEIMNNPFSAQIIENLKISLEYLVDKEKLFTFEWEEIKNKMNNISPNLYETISSTVDGSHLDRYGNKLVYEILKDDIEKFLC